MLLVILLLIHSIKLLHNHSANSLSHHVCNGSCFENNDSSELAKTSADCGLCSYQLTKDADHAACPEFCSPIIEHSDLNVKLVSLNKFFPPSILENRGPPSILSSC